MKILVTGSNGCVGSALKSICAGQDDWIFTSRKDCDLTNREQTIDLFKQHKPEYVVHLASYVPGFYNIDRVASFATNVRVNENVLEASHLSGIDRGMFCLSVNMFPEHPVKFPMDESMLFDGNLTGAFAGYSYAKRMLALQCQNYNIQYNRKYFGIIPCNVYGPNDNLKSGRLIPNLILKFKEAVEQDSDVVINGTGKPLRQFIYSIDLAKIIKGLVANYFDTKPIICCSDTENTIAELAITIGQLIKFQKQITFDISKPDGNLKKTVDNSYLKQVLPNISFTSLEAGLSETIKDMGIV
ncbi:MAG TPA: NAD-dependent epimerase/dehydratase family protein [Anaerovoracaceae bacterium]|nr:NAD-dependent epimerase/dehydratase family protein [Anaerovoracaceae bacterium]